MVAAGVWAAQQPLDKRVFECGYDDVELLGKLAAVSYTHLTLPTICSV